MQEHHGWAATLVVHIAKEGAGTNALADFGVAGLGHGLPLEFDTDVAQFGVKLKRMHTPLASNTRCLSSAKSGAQIA